RHGRNIVANCLEAGNPAAKGWTHLRFLDRKVKSIFSHPDRCCPEVQAAFIEALEGIAETLALWPNQGISGDLEMIEGHLKSARRRCAHELDSAGNGKARRICGHQEGGDAVAWTRCFVSIGVNDHIFRFLSIRDERLAAVMSQPSALRTAVVRI